jgi:hypothetical protein
MRMPGRLYIAAPPAFDRRRSPRRPTRHIGTILSDSTAPPHYCLVEEVSEGGVRICAFLNRPVRSFCDSWTQRLNTRSSGARAESLAPRVSLKHPHGSTHPLIKSVGFEASKPSDVNPIDSDDCRSSGAVRTADRRARLLGFLGEVLVASVADLANDAAKADAASTFELQQA